MKIHLAIAVLSVLLVAPAASAALETVLTPDGVVYTVDDSAETTQLQLSRQLGGTLTVVLVPLTEDAELESQPRLLWDSAASTLVVVWNHRAADGDEIRLARLDAQGQWSAPLIVSSAAGFHRAGLQVELTRAEIDDAGSQKATLIHAAWWSLDATPIAEYALVAFEAGEHVSTRVDALDALRPSSMQEGDVTQSADIDFAIHPAMAMARAASGVDVVYGRQDSTVVTRLHLDPRRIVSNARMWKPLGKTGERTGPSGLVAANSAPIQASLGTGRIVLYTLGTRFQFVVFENGSWSPVRMVELDDEMVANRHRLMQQLAQ